MTILRKFEPLGLILATVLVVLDGYLWYLVLICGPVTSPHDYFLDIGQGDSELIVFQGGARIMTDAGPLDEVLQSLGDVLGGSDHYIDVGIISHPQLDHFNGYNYLLDNGYHFGAFIYNGRDDDPPNKEWSGLLAKIKEKNIPLLTLGAGDSIRQGSNTIALLSPNKDFAMSAELNDTGFVELITTPAFKTLLTADTGFNVEDFLMAHGFDLHVDVLKVGHHGSNYASGDAFLAAVDPKIAVIEVGAHNTYGHPGKQTLERLASSTKARVFRTDLDGTVTISLQKGKLTAVPDKRAEN